MIDAGSEGLRERKRRATREAIEREALELALVHGYDNVTVEMICERANISPRTFFNYAGSKERAVLGIGPPLPDQSHRDAYLGGMGGSPLEDLVSLMVKTLTELGGVNNETMLKRHRVMQENPHLALKEYAQMEEVENVIVDLVRRRLDAEEPARTDETATRSEAGMIVSLTVGIMRYLVQHWVSEGAPSTDAPVLRDALSLARRVLTA